MTLPGRIFFLFYFIFPFLLFSQEKSEVYDSSGRLIAYFENDILKEAGTGRPLFTVKGNLIFTGASDDKKDIFLLVKIQDIFSESIGEVLNSNLRETVFTINDGRFYKGQTDNLNDDLILGYYDSDSSGTIKFYDGHSGNVLATLPGPALSAGKMVALFYVLERKFGLDQILEQRLKELKKEKGVEPAGEATYGSIKRLWDTGMEQFEWDGEILKRKWNSIDFEEWRFDGTTLQRAWYPGEDEFIWDGEVMRRQWYSSPDEFEWDGRILRRRWGNDEFIIQGNIVKRYLDSSGKDDWEIEGDMPVPIIALVVFNLLRK